MIIIICTILCLVIGICSTLSINVEQYEEDGYLDISLKWLFFNALYLVGQTVFTAIKYFVAVVCFILFIGLLCLTDGDIGGDPVFFADGKWWTKMFRGEIYICMVIWVVCVFIWTYLLKIPCIFFATCVSSAFKFLVISPFVWIRQSFGGLFDSSFFTIGKKK